MIDSDYVTSSSNISSDSEESNGDDDTENTESCESEDWEPPDKDNDTWEPNKPLCPDQSDRSLRSHDLQKVTHATCADTTASLEMDISENSQKKTETSNIPNNGRRNCIQKMKQPGNYTLTVPITTAAGNKLTFLNNFSEQTIHMKYSFIFSEK